MQITELEAIKITERPKILLLGNGINRSFGNASWSSLLAKISCTSHNTSRERLINELPFPLQAIIITGDNVEEGVKLISDALISEKVSAEHQEILNTFLNIPFDAILTTNYTYEIEQSLDEDFRCINGKSCKYRNSTHEGNTADEQFGLFKYMHVNERNIWHIHGEAGRSRSMVLGHYDYGKLLSRVQNHISSFIKRYKAAEKHKSDFIPLSWIDYFMLGDVYVVGLGLDSSELDLWWLINCKKRHLKDINSGSIYWYEPNLNKRSEFGRLILAETNGIKHRTENVDCDGYKDYYRNLHFKVEKDLDVRK